MFTAVQKNLKKNISFYMLYLISVSVVLMLFYFSISFAGNEQILEKLMGNTKLKSMINIVLPLLMIFVLFYMSYSNKFFMKRRMKELGIYTLLGFKKRKITQILFLENILICAISLVIGILLGSVLFKGLMTFVINILELSIDSSQISLFNNEAIVITTLFVCIAMLVLLISNYIFIKKTSLLSLIRTEEKHEKQIKLNLWKAILGIASLLAGYVLAIDIKRGTDSLWLTIGFSPISMLTFILVVIGTICSIQFFIPYTLQKIKLNKKLFYRDTSIIVIPQFVQRVYTNARVLILTTLISATALCLLAAGVITFYYPVKAIDRTNPAAFEFPAEDTELVNRAIDTVERELGKSNNLTHTTQMIQVTSSSEKLPYEYSVKEKPSFDLISESNYKEAIKLRGDNVPELSLSNNNVIFVEYNKNQDDETGMSYQLNLSSSEKVNVTVQETTLNNTLSFANSVGTLIVSDQLYEEALGYELPTQTVISIYGENLRDNKELHEQLSSLFSDEPRFQSAVGRETTYIQENSAALLISIFASAIFLIATGSILYFTNLSNAYSKINEFSILNRLGFEKRKLKSIVSKQILITLVVPYVIGSIHSIFALESFKALMPNLIGDSSAFWFPELIGIGLFTIIYIIYYQITKFSCYKVIFNKQ
ncbi:ABC transporter permease [Bacillus solimangrovi]|uniref:ABC transporter permease n=1 Tax=Bacillus solimangrovi TaxID=1305675 RepID=UPI001FE215B0|nr:FtsX-like permease family protein [Bacillus solimangrovi]